MSEEAKDKPAEIPAPGPQPPAAPVSEGPKKILEALEKDASAAAAPKDQSAAQGPAPAAQPAVPDTPGAEPAIPAQDAQAPESSSPSLEAPAAAPMNDGPLITDAMRRLDELLARFKGPS